MKKQTKKLTLYRETLHTLEGLGMRGVAGASAATVGRRCTDGDTVGVGCASAGTCTSGTGTTAATNTPSDCVTCVETVPCATSGTAYC